MKKLSLYGVAAICLAACAEPVAKSSTEAERVEEVSELRRDSRLRLIEGRDMQPDELRALGEEFASNLENFTLNEAKQCRVSLYTKSYHYAKGYPTGFDVDFKEKGREQARVHFLAFLYYGINSHLRKLEREVELERIKDAPSSVKQQILREGKFHEAVESLARCKGGEMAKTDADLPYYKLYCAATTKQEQVVLSRRIDNMQAYCEKLGREYLETGAIKPESYEMSPMVFK